jgi:hypothetical protein
MVFTALLWCLLGVGVVVPAALALRGTRLGIAILSGALSPLLLGVTFLASLVGSWGSVGYGREHTRTVALGIASILSAGTWAAGTALAIVIALVRHLLRRPADGIPREE